MDIAIEEDLIEEVARIHGYDNIPEVMPSGDLSVGSASSHDVDLRQIQQSLCTAGYQEIISYSFVDRKLLKAVHQDKTALPLANPLSSDMDVMRTTLLPGLLSALAYNTRRQQDRVRLYETGVAFLQGDELTEVHRLGGVSSGTAWPEQWSGSPRQLDFYDVKGDVERILALRGGKGAEFSECERSWMHPGCSADVSLDGRIIGWCGAVHPAILKNLDIDDEVFAFELDLDPIQDREIPKAGQISRFPSIRRDLAIWIPESVTYREVNRLVAAEAGDLLQKLVVFDVYRDKKLKKGYKSLAIGLILQNVSSTLTDEHVDPVIQKVITVLEQQLAAELRG
jgi:phenylalanyl-tRNA synthetase beta chain